MRVPASAAAEPAAVPPTLQLVRENRPAGAGAPPLITVVVCAYRHAAYIDECLASVDATAPGIAIELIVIDDGSPDDTLARCLAFAFRTDLRLRIYTKPNQGLVHSLQCGLALAEGRYFAVMASADFLNGRIQHVATLESRLQEAVCRQGQDHQADDSEVNPHRRGPRTQPCPDLRGNLANRFKRKKRHATRSSPGA